MYQTEIDLHDCEVLVADRRGSSLQMFTLVSLMPVRLPRLCAEADSECRFFLLVRLYLLLAEVLWSLVLLMLLQW